MKKKKDPILCAALLFILTIIFYAVVTGIKIQEANKITGSFVKIPLETKLYILPWILIFIFICTMIYMHIKN